MKTSILRSDLYDTYILPATFENNTPFRSCISNTDDTFIENAEELDIVTPMYYLLEHSNNYSLTSVSLWNCYTDEINDVKNENVNDRMNNYKTITSKSFEYKTKLKGTTPNDNNILDTEDVVPLNI